MATAMQLINKAELASGQSSVTFGSIPNTYKDLWILARLGTGDSQVWGYYTFNGTGTTGYTNYSLYTDGSTVTGGNDQSSTGYQYTLWATTPSNGTYLYGATQIYIPSYADSNNKPSWTHSLTERNQTGVYQFANANLWTTSSPITSITFTPWNSGGGETWRTGSTFYLYGIKNN